MPLNIPFGKTALVVNAELGYIIWGNNLYLFAWLSSLAHQTPSAAVGDGKCEMQECWAARFLLRGMDLGRCALEHWEQTDGTHLMPSTVPPPRGCSPLCRAQLAAGVPWEGQSDPRV